jgi:uncharacterized protein YlxP (DUF503 family)
MIVGTLKLSLHIPYNHSLKEKRRTLKSLLSRIQHEFNVAAAEVDANDLWQMAQLGFAVVSNDGQHANQVLSHVVEYVRRWRPDMEILDYHIEIISLS